MSRTTLIRVCIGAALIAVLMTPALWNGYPLLQLDTGGYLARWYEGYLVPSRSTVAGLYLHLGESTHFWLNVAAEAAATVWIVSLTMKCLGLDKPWQMAFVLIVLTATTALPFLVSALLTDVIAGLAIVALYLIVFHNRDLGLMQTGALIAFTAFGAASHSITLAILLALCGGGWVAMPFLRTPFLSDGLSKASLGIVGGALLLLVANYNFSGQMAWTPGGTGIAFGRMLQDGIVARYLNDHCSNSELRLCPYRDRLPATADEFLWSDNSVFNELGRFDGLGDEMQSIASNALVEYPGLQLKTVLSALARQLTMVATGEGIHDKLTHTYTIFDQYMPNEAIAMRRARQQQGELNFRAINFLHIPVALASMAILVALVTRGLWLRQGDELTAFLAAILVTLIANAFICAAISGPHDRYGSRFAWLATFAVLVAGLRAWRPAPRSDLAYGRRARKASTPSL